MTEWNDPRVAVQFGLSRSGETVAREHFIEDLLQNRLFHRSTLVAFSYHLEWAASTAKEEQQIRNYRG
jgi:hypothetical protein